MVNVSVNVSLPEQMREHMFQKVRSGDYGSVSEYVRELIRLDQRTEFARREAAIERQIQFERGHRPAQYDYDE